MAFIKFLFTLNLYLLLKIYLFYKKQPAEVFFIKNVFLKILQNSLENTFLDFFLIKLQACEIFKNTLFEEHLPQTCNFIKKETLAQVFSYEFWEIFKNLFFTEHVLQSASVLHSYDLNK